MSHLQWPHAKTGNENQLNNRNITPWCYNLSIQKFTICLTYVKGHRQPIPRHKRVSKHYKLSSSS